MKHTPTGKKDTEFIKNGFWT